MIRVGMGDEDVGYLLPLQIEPPKGNLGALSAVEEHEIPFSTQQDRSQASAG